MWSEEQVVIEKEQKNFPIHLRKFYAKLAKQLAKVIHYALQIHSTQE
jgi:hypothetical protein